MSLTPFAFSEPSCISGPGVAVNAVTAWCFLPSLASNTFLRLMNQRIDDPFMMLETGDF